MRSTRIRTPDRTLLTVPNNEFSNMRLENYTNRDCMALNTTLQVRYETTPDPFRVRFSGFGAHSLNNTIYAYVLTSNRSK